MGQISFFDGEEKLRATKPVRLIELFAGIGSQAKALENLGADFETYFVCEFDEPAIKSYNAIHHTDFQTSDVTKITAQDINIVDTDKYDYILTYSFPCQDLSLAGKQRGLEKGSGTRSGLLWEVERLLREMIDYNGNLPKILLMENVPQVLTAKGFPEWIQYLESIGYSSRWEVMNAADYGIPQHRERAFMVSYQGNYYYDFPEPIKLRTRLKHYLDEDVEEKYFLSQKAVSGLCRQLENT